MRDTCIPIEQLEAVAALPEDAPPRRHLEACPRCRARWLELQDLMRADTAPAEARPDEARERLRRFLDEELLAPAATRTTPRRRVPRPRLAWTWPTAVRFAAAAAAIVAVGVVWTRQQTPAPRPGAALRGGSPPGVSSDEQFAVAVETGPTDGGLRLVWSPIAGAERYEVTLHAADLSVLARIDAGDRRECVVPDSLRNSSATTATLARVRALTGEDEAARSNFLRLPERPAR